MVIQNSNCYYSLLHVQSDYKANRTEKTKQLPPANVLLFAVLSKQYHAATNLNSVELALWIVTQLSQYIGLKI